MHDATQVRIHRGNVGIEGERGDRARGIRSDAGQRPQFTASSRGKARWRVRSHTARASRCSRTAREL